MIALTQKELPFPESPKDRRKMPQSPNMSSEVPPMPVDPLHVSTVRPEMVKTFLIPALVNGEPDAKKTALTEARRMFPLSDVVGYLQKLKGVTRNANGKPVFTNENVETAIRWVEDHWNDEDVG